MTDAQIANNYTKFLTTSELIFSVQFMYIFPTSFVQQTMMVLNSVSEKCIKGLIQCFDVWDLFHQ